MFKVEEKFGYNKSLSLKVASEEDIDLLREMGYEECRVFINEETGALCAVPQKRSSHFVIKKID